MIVYFSRSGKTAVVAQALHTLTGLPLHPLEADISASRGFSFAFQAIKGAFTHRGNTVANMPESLPPVIYCCAPIWAGDPAGPMKYFLAQAALGGVTVHMVLTAMSPSHQYRTAGRRLLQRTQATPGHITLIATTKTPPEPEVVQEHLQHWLDHPEE